MVNRAIQLQGQDKSTTLPGNSEPPKSATQLRLQTLGALLSLAPHNIRYDELVAEGINPAILKQLYEEIGIKIAATGAVRTPVTASSISEPVDPLVAQQKSPDRGQLAGSQKYALKSKPEVQKPVLAPSKAPVSASSQSDSDKPMERKELIAKMLAAKAAKPAQPHVSKATRKEAQSPASSVITPPNEVQNKTNGVAAREKNKAQTELARQRIEELKRQALLRKQQQSQKAIQSDKSLSEDQSSNLSSPAVQHPLPIRPPVPRTLESPGIPGLFMTGSQHGPDGTTPASLTPGIAVDSTPVTRATQRKRPRASDFDEPVAAPKKRLSQDGTRPGGFEKLIIDISDEESLYGDDEGEAMEVDSSPELRASSTAVVTPGIPSLREQNSDTRTSTSTPRGTARPSGEENMRQRDLEIQSMRRKIAELEQKRLAKLAASRTQTPRAVGDSDDSPAAVPSTVTETKAAESSNDSLPIVESTPQELATKEGMGYTPVKLMNMLIFLQGPSSSQSSINAGTYTDAEDSVEPHVTISPSAASTASSESLGSESAGFTKRPADNKVISESEQPSNLFRAESFGSAMEQSSDSYDSAETSSDEEVSKVSDAQLEADAVASNPEPMDMDPSGHPGLGDSQPPIWTNDTEGKLDSKELKSANDHREVSEGSDSYEPSEGQPTSRFPAEVGSYDSENQNRPSDKDSVLSLAESDAYEPPEPEEPDAGNNATDWLPLDTAAPAPAIEAAKSPPTAKEADALSQVRAFESSSDFQAGLLGV